MHDDRQLDSIALQARDYMLHRDMGFDLLMAADYLELDV
jgi:hypothetical protein